MAELTESLEVLQRRTAVLMDMVDRQRKEIMDSLKPNRPPPSEIDVEQEIMQEEALRGSGGSNCPDNQRMRRSVRDYLKRSLRRHGIALEKERSDLVCNLICNYKLWRAGKGLSININYPKFIWSYARAAKFDELKKMYPAPHRMDPNWYPWWLEQIEELPDKEEYLAPELSGLTPVLEVPEILENLGEVNAPAS